MKKSVLLSVGSVAWLTWTLLSSPLAALSQVIEDTTLPNPTRVRTNGNTFAITGGTRPENGRNLFHSFRSFSVPDGSTALFQDIDPTIANILTRVTGSDISRINGAIAVLQPNGTVSPANLFLLNPNGIIFGPNASLNLGGSFLATTARSINFADGTQFSATTPPTTSLLTVSAPVGLQFGQNPGRIINRSTTTAQDITGQSARLNGEEFLGGLQVLPHHTLALVGGDLQLAGGYLFTAGGRVELGSVVSPDQVSLTETDRGWVLGYSGVRRLGRIRLSDGATVDTSGVLSVAPDVAGGGAIQVQAGEISLRNGSLIVSNTEGEQDGETLVIHASERMVLDEVSSFSTETSGIGNAGNINVSTAQLEIRAGASIFSGTDGDGQSGALRINAMDTVLLEGVAPQPGSDPSRSGLTTFTVAASTTGMARDVRINTSRLIIRDGAELGSITVGAARGGNVIVDRVDSIQIEGTSSIRNSDNTPVTSNLFAQTLGEGRAGNIRISTDRLLVQDGGQLSTITFGSGDAGNLTVRAREITLAGIATDAEGRPILVPDQNRLSYPSGMLTGVENIEGTTEGNGGLLRITTQDLTIRDGAVLQTNTFDAGNAGNLVVNADSIDVSGTSIDNLNPSGITAYSGGIPGTNFRRVATATGRSGDLTVNARELTVRNGAVIAAGSVNPNRNANAAGNLMINTQRLNLNDRSSLLANTNSGNGGEIQLRIEDLLLLGENSAISTTAGLIGRGGDGGSITINDRTDTLPDGFIVANPSGNSDITANANQGSGGNVEISSRGILGLRPLDRSELAERLNNPTNPAELDPQRLSTSDITAISQVSPNLSGQITFNAPDVDPSRGLVELPTDLIDRSQQIAQTCAPRDTQNSFVTTGRSGLPLSPDEVLRSAAVIPLDWVTLDSESENLSTSRTHDRAEETTESASENSSQYQNESEIIEATEWSQDANGNVTLIAQSTLPQFPSHACTSPLSP